MQLIDLDIKDIKVDKVDLDVLGKATQLLSLYSHQSDFKKPIVPATAPKDKMPKHTKPCSTTGGLLGRASDVDLCILADLYHERPEGTIVSLFARHR